MKSSDLPRFLFLGATLAAASAALAQPADAVQQRYEREIAACNSGDRAATTREACKRAAGNAADRARGGPPVEVPQLSGDGRATIVAPAGTAPTSGSTATITSPDGRATIVLPADRAVPQP